MSKGNTFENDMLQLIFNAVAIANLAQDNGTGPLASLFVALHTSDPGEAGSQTTNEISYSGYGRVVVARSSAGFTVSANAVTNTAAVTFGACIGGSGTATHFSVGTLISGAGKILYSGSLSSPLAISTGITPSFAIGQLSITED